MRNVIQKILKEETSNGKRDKIDAFLKLLKRIYPKIDYCIDPDDRLKIYMWYDHNEPGGIFKETGLMLDPIPPPSDFWVVGEFSDYRNDDDGTYDDTDVEVYERSPTDTVIEIIDHHFGNAEDVPWATPNYYGIPGGDQPMFNWREC